MKTHIEVLTTTRDQIKKLSKEEGRTLYGMVQEMLRFYLKNKKD